MYCVQHIDTNVRTYMICILINWIYFFPYAFWLIPGVPIIYTSFLALMEVREIVWPLVLIKLQKILKESWLGSQPQQIVPSFSVLFVSFSLWPFGIFCHIALWGATHVANWPNLQKKGRQLIYRTSCHVISEIIDHRHNI